MPGTNEAFSRVKIDAQLKDQGWDVLNSIAVRFEYVLPDRTKADYVLCDRHGRALAVIEAKRAAINPAEAEVQAKAYAAQLKVPYVFLANGEEIRFWEWQREAFPRVIKTFFSQGGGSYEIRQLMLRPAVAMLELPTAAADAWVVTADLGAVSAERFRHEAYLEGQARFANAKSCRRTIPASRRCRFQYRL